jgi:hypothetical protein
MTDPVVSTTVPVIVPDVFCASSIVPNPAANRIKKHSLMRLLNISPPDLPTSISPFETISRTPTYAFLWRGGGHGQACYGISGE